MKSIIPILGILLSLFCTSQIHAQSNKILELSPEINKIIETGDYELALTNSKEQLTGIKKDNPNYLRLRYQYGTILIYTQATQAAYEVYLEVMEGIASKYGKDASYAVVAGYLAYLEQDLGDFEAAEKHYLEAISLSRKLKATETEEYATTLSNLAMLYSDLGRFKPAIQYTEEVLVLFEKLVGKDHEAYSTALNNLGLLYENIGRYDKAEAHYWTSIKITEKLVGKKHPSYAMRLLNVAAIYRLLGRYSDAEPIYIEADSVLLATVGSRHPAYASLMHNKALLFSYLKRNEEAERLYLNAKNLRAELLGKEHPDYALSLNNIAKFYTNAGRYEEAEQYLIELKELAAKIFGIDNPLYATAVNNLASFYGRIGRFKDAEKLFNEVKVIRLKNFGRNSIAYAEILSNLAGMHVENKEFNIAESQYKEVMQIYLDVVGKEHPKYAQVLNFMANLHLKSESPDKALIYCLKALDANSPNLDASIKLGDELFSKMNVADYYLYSELFNTLLHLDRYFQIKKDIKNGLKIELLAAKFNERIRYSFITDSDKLDMLSENLLFLNKGMQSCATLLKTAENKLYLENALYFSEQNKSILLQEVVRGTASIEFGKLPDSLFNKEKDLQLELSLLKKKMQEATPSERSKINLEISNLDKEIAAFQAMLTDKFPKYQADKYKGVDISIKTIQENIPEGQLIIEYFMADSILYAISLTKNSVELKILVDDFAELNANIEALRIALTDYSGILKTPEKSYALYTSAAFWCFDRLLKPLLKENISSLLIIPDGTLGHLPFEAFLEYIPKEEQNYTALPYLLKKYAISYHYSLSLWQEQTRAPKKQVKNGMLALAASYGDKAEQAETRSLRSPQLRNLRDALQDLPAAKSEVEGLAKLFKGDFLYGSDANEAFFKHNAQNYAVIHLAMHGLLNTEYPILSSLAFTENGDSTEDNFLQAYEISHLNLNAELVVLSACETGYGKFQQGEGVMSLARSFMYAGVPSLVVSMWQVNDESTSLIMQNFYLNLSKGMDKAEALRQAKLEYIENAGGGGGGRYGRPSVSTTTTATIAAHPAFWAPFIQLGDISPIRIQKTGAGYMIWIWAIGAPLLIIVGFWWFMRGRRKEA